MAAAYRLMRRFVIKNWARCSSNYSQSSIICWECQKELSVSAGTAMFTCPCEKGIILPPTTTNYFQIMDCTETFDVSLDVLKNRYCQLQVLLHPDKSALKSSKEQEYAAEHSSLVNKAYSTLSNPYSRGIYMLKLNGVVIDEKDNIASEEGGVDFLEKIMSVREEIQFNPTQERLSTLYNENEGFIDDCIIKVSKCFADGDIETAKKSLSAMKYYLNIKEEIKLKLVMK